MVWLPVELEDEELEEELELEEVSVDVLLEEELLEDEELEELEDEELEELEDELLEEVDVLLEEVVLVWLEGASELETTVDEERLDEAIEQLASNAIAEKARRSFGVFVFIGGTSNHSLRLET